MNLCCSGVQSEVAAPATASFSCNVWFALASFGVDLGVYIQVRMGGEIGAGN